MRFTTLLLTGFFLAGCGAVWSTKLDVRTNDLVTFEFHDERPSEQRVTSSYKQYSHDQYLGAVKRLGDDSVTPSGPTLLKTWLNNKLSKPLSGKKVVLHEFTIQIFDPAIGEIYSAGADPVVGLFADLFIAGIESARSNKAVSVRISGKVGKHEFSGQGDGSFKGRVSESEVNSVITQALDTATSEIERLITSEQKLSSKSAISRPLEAATISDH